MTRAVTLLALAALLTFSCSKENSGPSANVYVGGFTGTPPNSVAVYWKNGVITELTNANNLPSAATDVLVVGTDVYVAGNITDNFISTAVYWKNGVMTTLGASNSSISSIAAEGTDMYFAGVENSCAGYWKNGTFTVLACANVSPPTNPFSATDIAVFGPDVYVVGFQELDTAFVPILWKNGVQTVLPGNSGDEQVAVGSAGVFVEGTTTTEYLNNGTEATLPGGYYITTIGVSGADVYAGGFASDSPGATGYPAYWKNGVKTKMDNTTTPRAIQALGADVYVVGNPDISGSSAVVWKNGVGAALTTTGVSHANGLCVVQ